MKKLLLIISLALFSCNSFFEDDIGLDPNNATSVPIQNRLASIQLNLVDVYGGEFSRLSSLLTQQVEGLIRACFTNYNYTGITPETFNTSWSTIYERVLGEIYSSKIQCGAGNAYHHLGILQILEALTLMMATDVWDAIPYSEAFQGLNSINASFDPQSEIYDNVFQLIEVGIENLNNPLNSVEVEHDDLFYSGNINNWIKAAHVLKARALLRFERYSEILELRDLGFDSPDQNLGMSYPGSEAAESPWFRFNRDRTGNIEWSSRSHLHKLMTELNDHSRLESLDQPFNINHPYFTANQFQELISFREFQFIIAEAELKVNGELTRDGFNSYLAGIESSFQLLNLPDTSFTNYVANIDVNPGRNSITLDHILDQKYIALFTNPECYNDLRRNDYPLLIASRGSTIPVRWEYSQAEYDFNSNAPAIGSINIFEDKVAWDK